MYKRVFYKQSGSISLSEFLENKTSKLIDGLASTQFKVAKECIKHRLMTFIKLVLKDYNLRLHRH